MAVAFLQVCGGFHSSNVLRCELRLAALAAKPLHQRRHHGLGVVVRQLAHLRPPGHGEDKRTQHGAAHDVQLEAVALFKRRQFCDNLLILWLGLSCDLFCGVGVIAQHRQLLLKGFYEQPPHGHGHSRPTHFTSPLSILSESGSFASRCRSGSGGIPSDSSLPPETRASRTGRSQPAA